MKRHIIEAEHDQAMNAIPLTPELLCAINKDSDKITKAEFILHMLQLAGKLEKSRDIDFWDERFKEFDFDHDGYLTMADCNSYKKIVEKIDLGKISRKRPNKKKSILLKAAEETRDVFLETFKLKKIDEGDEEDEDDGTARGSVSFDTISPLALAKLESGEGGTGRAKSSDRGVPASPKRSTVFGMGGGASANAVAPTPHDSVSSINSLRDWSARIERENEMRSSGASNNGHSSVSSISSISGVQPATPHRNNSISAIPTKHNSGGVGSGSGTNGSSPTNKELTALAAHRSVQLSSAGRHGSSSNRLKPTPEEQGEEGGGGSSSGNSSRSHSPAPTASAASSTFVPFNVGYDDDAEVEK